MEVHPPWASELLARNRKVARNIVWSTSLDAGLSSHLYPSDHQFPEEREPRKLTPILISGSATGVMKMTKDERCKVVELNPSASRLGSEKSVNIKREGSADEEVGYNQDNMKEKNNGEESFLEYGPGIVRKLRSRYQSLALRHSSGRPSLRRSTSLENVLDAVSDTLQSSTTPSPVPYNDGVFENGHHHTIDKHPEVNYIKNGNSTGSGGDYGNKYVNRSRQGYNGDYNRKDRMRRARSVDALHRGTKREEEEREIFEKFKTVVLPKEEIVIIEVSKPRANLSSDIYGKYYGIEDKLGSSSAPLGNTTQLSHSRSSPAPHTLSTSNSNGHYPSELNRVRSLASPEHELPPPDIVRETARIFEKNTDSTQQSPTTNNPTSNHLISNFKKVGHALRLNKSSSVSPNSSPLPSPTIPNGKIIMNGGQHQNGIPYHHSQNKSHLLQGSANAKSIEPSTILNGIKSSVASPKQVGIIRPTLASPTANPGAVINGKSSSPASPNLNNSASPTKKVPVPEVSPILRSSDRNFVSDNKALSQTRKPPLSPKPIFTSSPKNIFLIQNTKNGPSKLTETCNVTTNGCPNNKSTEDVPMKMESVDNNRISSENNVSVPPTNALAQSRGLANSVGGGGPPKSNRPSEKENNKNVMEFQQIALKPVAKPEPSDNVVINNNIKNTNNSSVLTPTPVTETKTERKQDTTSSTLAKPQIVASTMKSHPIPAPRAPAVIVEKPKEQQPPSQLRTHQKQVSDKKKQASAGGTMVFDFTKRPSVPDYIEDDGLHRDRGITLVGTVTDESHDDDIPTDFDQVDSKLIQFEGANVIINGRSSIQKRPKSQKLNISINEDATTTFEYPSEISMLSTDEPPSDNILVHKTPNLTTGSELGNYTSNRVGTTYQLGTYENKKAAPPSQSKKEDNVDELIEDYLRPDKESTTWSNEIGADILF